MCKGELYVHSVIRTVVCTRATRKAEVHFFVLNTFRSREKGGPSYIYM